MATYGTQVRRGLPRRPGGDPWPPAAEAPIEVVPAADESADPVVQLTDAASEAVAAAAAAPVAEPATAAAAASASAAPARAVRRGLPRVPGGEPWPPASVAPAVVEQAPAPAAEPAAAPAATDPATVSAPRADVATATTPAAEGTTPLRRGLPRVAGGEPWPPAGFAPGAETTAAPAPTVAPAPTTPPAETSEPSADLEVRPAAASVEVVPAGPRAPLPFTPTVFPGASARVFEKQRLAGGPVLTPPEPERIGPFTKVQWAGAVVVGGLGLLFAAFMAVVAVRWLLSTEPLQDFLQTYPGEYHLPETAPVGIPAWIGWQHFFNVFLMVLIIRSGLQVRTEKRPTAFWTPRNKPKGKISLALWFHQGLDILWLVNGAIFVVLLFVTGQWMRIVPTSWEVFPNALSAVLQYISLDWPTENGWVNYNSVQQLAYFTTVFIAAPLAAITGARMTKMWPQNAKTLNRLYPVEWARALHFPVMIYFCLFIFVHVVLVFATGALRNLNHMYAAQGSVDGVQYADNWAGFWIFFASMVVIVGAWIAARPLVLAPIARLFGNVSGR